MWLMPLGAFIRPSQEKTACDGQRPFHMCSMAGKIRADDAGFSSKVNFTNASGVNAGAKYSASQGNDFLLSGSAIVAPLSHSQFYEFIVHSSYPLVLHSLEHIPKI